MPPAEEPSIPITSLPIQELANLKQRIEAEYEQSKETQQQIRRLIAHFNATIASIQTLAESKQGKQLGARGVEPALFPQCLVVPVHSRGSHGSM